MSLSTRRAFGEALVLLGEKHPEIVVLDADLSKSTQSELFAKKFPERFFEMGISEANMIGAAAGLAFAGKLPFACSFGCFLTGRYDTIRLSVAYAQANVRLVGTHAGLGVGEDGYSQMGLEDISLMRALPTMGVFQPMDAEETRLILEYLVSAWRGPAYLRLTRQNLPDFPLGGAVFQPGKLRCILEKLKSQRVLVLATGSTVEQACLASEILETSPIGLSVWNVHCLKPFDEATLLELMQGYSLVVTVEDHTVVAGLGSAVAQVMAQVSRHPRLICLGVQDIFGESGKASLLYERFGISGAAIASRILHEFT